jgi:hypothetical protein
MAQLGQQSMRRAHRLNKRTRIAFLAWAYLSGFIFRFGAFVSVSYYQLKPQQEAAGQIQF